MLFVLTLNNNSIVLNNDVVIKLMFETGSKICDNFWCYYLHTVPEETTPDL